jgi:hypothetical protein
MDRYPRKATRRTLLVGLLPLALMRGAVVDYHHITPLDESDKDAAFRRFRRSLLTAIRDRNVQRLLALVAPDILNDGSGGRDEFRRAWRLEQAATSPVWHLLAETVQLGCVRNRKGASGFVAPYVYALFPDKLDAVMHFVVVKPAAKLYERPAALSPVIETLHWDIMEYLEGDVRFVDWHNVRAASGREGFVRDTDVRSPTDYHAIFEKRNGQWLMTSFL